MPQAPRKPRPPEKIERQTRKSQQPRTTPNLAQILNQPRDFKEAHRRLADDCAAAARGLTAAQLAKGERGSRAKGMLDIAAAFQSEIARRAKEPTT